MRILDSVRRVVAAGAFGALLTGCGGVTGLGAWQPAEVNSRNASSTSPIAHVVLIVQENRTFNNFFATFPGADGTTTGIAAKDAKCHIGKTRTVKLRISGLIEPSRFDHYYAAYRTARDGGKMDGFDEIAFEDHTDACMQPYQYVDPSQIQPYWDMAKQYTLAEHMFATQGSGGFSGHQDLITGGTVIASNEALVNFPTCKGHKCHWGCDAPANTHTDVISKDDVLGFGKGPFPCSNDFTSSYPTIRDLLDAKGLSWKYYAPRSCCSTNGRLFNAFDMIYPVRYGPEWKANISSPETNILGDISSGSLPAMSWVIPDADESDHPGANKDTGPSWVASIVNAIGESPYWNSTAIIVVWDDWGGLYDNLNPLQRGFGGFGFRVPAIIVSPYAKAGHISTTQYEFRSILKYVEQNWKLGYLGNGDRHADSLIDCFDYSQQPIKFSPIPSQHGASYFINHKPEDELLVDD